MVTNVYRLFFGNIVTANLFYKYTKNSSIVHRYVTLKITILARLDSAQHTIIYLQSVMCSIQYKTLILNVKICKFLHRYINVNGA